MSLPDISKPQDGGLKSAVRNYWDAQSCGEVYAAADGDLDLSAQEGERYRLEPYLARFAGFADGAGKDVLEVGVGMGADHLQWAKSKPRRLAGIDLTPRAIGFTSRRIADAGFTSDLRVADAENLPFEANSFDIVYSWGVMHHSPNTQQCYSEAARVLRPGGVARIMVYHTWSLIGFMLWARYGLLAGRPFRSLGDIYFHHLESPGTKAYTVAETRKMLSDSGFSTGRVWVQLSHGDLLEGAVGARHGGAILRTAKRLWPRALLGRVAGNLGLYLMIEASK